MVVLMPIRQFIEECHKTNIAYNLLYFPGQVYCFPRKMQGSDSHADWTPGFSCCELSGGILGANQDSYQPLTDAEIKPEFSLLNLNAV